MDDACLPTATPSYAGYTDDPAWVMELKYDGQRYLTEYTERGVFCYNRYGDRTVVPDAIPHGIPSGTILDGEVVFDRYYVFDVLKFMGTDVRSQPWEKRRHIIERLAETLGIDVTVVFVETTDRNRIIEEHRERGGEGVVFKLAQSRYSPGRTKDWLKYKFYETADVVILQFDYRGLAQSMELGVYHNGELTPIGGCKILPNDRKLLDVGDVVEVSYRPIRNAARLNEPVFLRVRPDKKATDCLPPESLRLT